MPLSSELRQAGPIRFPETRQPLLKLLLRRAVLLRRANRNASPVGVGRKGTADFDTLKAQRRRHATAAKLSRNCLLFCTAHS
jgi:hypothetical protein